MKTLMRTLKIISFGLLLLLVVLLGINVFMRYIIKSPIHWVEEAGVLILIWITFLGAVIAAHSKLHMGMDLILNKFKGKTGIFIQAIVNIITTVSILIVMYFGLEMTISNFNLESESLQIPYGFFYLAIPVGCLLFAIVQITQLIKLISPSNIKGGN